MKYINKIRKIFFKLLVNYRGSFIYFNTIVYCPKNCHLYSRIKNEGIYEEENLNIILSSITDNSYYIDIGANIGIMSIPILDRIKNCKVISIEPSPNSFPYLQKTFDNCSYKDRWSLINKAISDLVGSSKFTIFSEDYSAFEGLKNTERINIDSKEIDVEVVMLDNLWINMKKPNVSFIKVDVEGNEYFVIKGAEKLISKCKPNLQIECNAKNMSAYNINPENIIELVSEINYKIFKMPSRDNILYILKTYLPILEK